MGNVLVHFSHDRMCAQIGALCGKSGPEIRAILLDSGLQWEFERGLVSDVEFCRGLGAAANFAFELEALKHAGSNIFHLNEPMIPILEREYDVLKRFDDFVLSFQVGALKPDARIFEAALERIKCAPDECFYTDDIAAYVEAARGFGLQAEVFTGHESLLEQLRRRDVVLDV
jgi:putative hydrolase of the HAD superfamily